ncbi:MFS transporter [Brevibacterium sp. SIMBA_078]|uniref:MFS transporter n=1 Tax=Brevibacterium sp. SIMBA_078 TaxID=3085816 RepID=UPI003978E258
MASSNETPVSGYRWVILIAAWLSFTLTSIDRSTWGPASIFVADDLTVPLASLGAFATAYYIGYVASNALSGFLTDAFGGRIMLAVSLFGAGAAMFCFGSVKSAALGIAIQAVVGLFAGADYSAGVRLITSWFRTDKLGLPLGIFTTATSIGTAAANIVVPALIAQSGWELSYHLFGGISIVIAIALIFIVRSGPFLPKKEVGGEGRRGLALRPLAKNRNFILTCLAGFGAFWGLYGFITWSNTLMIKGYDLGSGTAGTVVAIVAISAIFSKPIIGFVSDRFFGGSRKAPSLILFALFAAALITFGNLSTATAFIIAAPFLGIVAYGWSPLLVSLVPRLVSGSVTGGASGLANATWQLGSVFAPLAVGAVFAASQSFNAAFLTLAAGPIVGIVFLAMVREQKATMPSSASRTAQKMKTAKQ